ncbi:MAG: hypothetical protein IT235_06455 [Bacteroidia bacterium]|nr:hypothetical protein [Bacteroidia bacterium]
MYVSLCKEMEDRDKNSSISYIMNTKNWWGPLVFILVISLLGVGMIGLQTYVDAPPMSGFLDNNGNAIITQQDIEKGQEVFHKYALMEYGSFMGDGAQRGPDFTAEALHWINEFMIDFYKTEFKSEKGRSADESELIQINEKVKRELKRNQYSEEQKIVSLTAAQTYALLQLRKY